MAQHPFDHKIRESMESKTIAPKDASWDRLQVMISQAEEQPTKKTSKSVWYLLAAAALVFGMFLTQWPAESKIQPVIGNAPSTERVTYSTDNKEAVKQITPQNTSKIDQKKEQQLQQLVDNRKTNKTASTKLSAVPLKTETEAVDPVDTRMANQVATDQSNSTVVEKISSNETYVSLLPEPKMKLKRFTVDPNSLLENTQDEMQKDFREGVFKRINNQYKTVKEAFVNRNEQ